MSRHIATRSSARGPRPAPAKAHRQYSPLRNQLQAAVPAAHPKRVRANAKASIRDPLKFERMIDEHSSAPHAFIDDTGKELEDSRAAHAHSLRIMEQVQRFVPGAENSTWKVRITLATGHSVMTVISRAVGERPQKPFRRKDRRAHNRHRCGNADPSSVIVQLAAQYRIPGVYASREFVDGGGLFSYSVNYPDLYLRAAHFVESGS